MSKYVKGDKIKNMNELVDICFNQQRSVWSSGHNRAMSYVWVMNQQFRYLHIHLGMFYKAELKPREEKKNGR